MRLGHSVARVRFSEALLLRLLGRWKAAAPKRLMQSPAPAVLVPAAAAAAAATGSAAAPGPAAVPAAPPRLLPPSFIPFLRQGADAPAVPAAGASQQLAHSFLLCHKQQQASSPLPLVPGRRVPLGENGATTPPPAAGLPLLEALIAGAATGAAAAAPPPTSSTAAAAAAAATRARHHSPFARDNPDESEDGLEQQQMEEEPAAAAALARGFQRLAPPERLRTFSVEDLQEAPSGGAGGGGQPQAG